MSLNGSEETRVWEQEQNESDRVYGHFIKWLALPFPDRRLTRAAKILGLTEGHLNDLSAVWKWQKRALAYDRNESENTLKEGAHLRRQAATAIARDILECVEARQGISPEGRDAAELQRLAASLKSVTPAMEEPAAAQEVRLDLDALYAAVRARADKRKGSEDAGS